MQFHILASGSKGNCTFIDFDGVGVLIDCGISKKQLLLRLAQVGYSYDDIQYVFVTHDHVDHNKTIHIFNKEKVYSAKECVIGLDEDHYLSPYDILTFQNFTLIPLKTSHDAHGCLGYEFIFNNQKLIYMTDTGYVSKKNATYMEDANYYIIESNHDVEMLMNTNRPMSLKNRILSDKGHLSNVDSAKLMCHLVGEHTRQIFLAHLSEEANTPELALNTYIEIMKMHDIDLNHISICTASQVEVVSGGEYEN